MESTRDDQLSLSSKHQAPMSLSDMPTIDHEHARFIADMIRFRNAELAELAANRLLRDHPEVASRYRPQPLQKWKEKLEGRLSDLAAAVAAASPEVFAVQTDWARIAFAARKVPVSDLLLSLRALASTLEHELPHEDRGVITSYITFALSRITSHNVQPPSSLSIHSPQGRLAAEYLLAILEGDRNSASDILLSAVKSGLSVTSAYTNVLVPAQRELGRMWHIGEISVAEEHFATATTRRVMCQLMSATNRAASNGKCVLVAAVEGNAHDLGIRVVGDFFELAGWRVIELGANVPMADLATAAMDFGADVVAISATIPNQLTTVEDTIRLIRAELTPLGLSPKVIVGGAAFFSCPELWSQIGADGYSADAAHAVELAEKLTNETARLRLSK